MSVREELSLSAEHFGDEADDDNDIEESESCRKVHVVADLKGSIFDKQNVLPRRKSEFENCE